MVKITDGKTKERVAAQLRANLARRKAQIREREEDPGLSALTYRDAPVHDPALRRPEKS
jgi:hypothetical protein